MRPYQLWLAPLHFVVALVILVWDILLAGRIAESRHASGLLQALSALCALLLLPALLLALATTTIITGRAVSDADWFWPVVLVLYAAQACVALRGRWRVRGDLASTDPSNPGRPRDTTRAMAAVITLGGLPIAVYNVIVAVIGITRYFVAHGMPVAPFMVTLLATQSTAVTISTLNPAAIASPYYVIMPMIASPFPVVGRLRGFVRAVMAVIAVGWTILLVLSAPIAIRALQGYRAHANDPLRERPNADFAVGLKVLPDIRNAPDASAVRSDSLVADTMDVDAISVTVIPGASNGAIDSLAHVIDQMRGESTTVIVTLGYRTKLIPELAPLPLEAPQRLTTIERVMRRMHPDILLPAEDPYGSGARALGRLPVTRWIDYLTQAAAAAKRINPRVRIGVSIAAFTRADSALYAWAAAPGSPVNVVGFSLFPSAPDNDLDALQRAADRWMAVLPPKKPHWVFATGGYPLAYGELNQERAIWQVLAWATNHPAIKGIVVYEAGDYGQSRGLRAPDGRLRAATFAVMKAIRALRESAR